MKKYFSYFPGCSSSDGGSKAYGQSTKMVAAALDIELKELEDSNCCGSTPFASIDELGSHVCSARNLALAQKNGLDLVTPCSSCYVILNRTNSALKEYPGLKAKVDESLAAGDLSYNGSTKVRHVLDVFTSDAGYEAISQKATNKLNGLKVAPYYGCQVVRPRLGFDDPENPQSMDKLVEALGAIPTKFPLKARCCGGSLIIPEESIALELLHNILVSATSNGAECIITACPLCQTNLDVYQRKVNSKYKTKYKIPVLFFTQLMGLAFGFDSKTLGIDQCIVPAEKILVGHSVK